MKSAGSKSRTSAAICTANPPASKDVMRSTPDTPAQRLRQKSGLFKPMGVIAPSPVTTTRVTLNLLTVAGPPRGGTAANALPAADQDCARQLRHRGSSYGEDVAVRLRLCLVS